MSNECVWEYDIRRDEYRTSCGNSYWFAIDTTPDIEGFEYCPFCGYPLVVKESKEK